jgi:hypothetical protein
LVSSLNTPLIIEAMFLKYDTKALKLSFPWQATIWIVIDHKRHKNSNSKE